MTKILAICIMLGFAAVTVLSTPDVSQKLYNIDQRCTLLEKLAPSYVWGGFWGPLGGDCSGQQYYIVFPDKPVKRTTAFRMWLGYGNWGTNNVEGSVAGFKDGDFPNLVFFNYQGKTASHVGMWRTKNKEEEKQKGEIKIFAEASSSSRYFKRTVMRKNDGRYRAILGTKVLDLH